MLEALGNMQEVHIIHTPHAHNKIHQCVSAEEAAFLVASSPRRHARPVF